MPTIVDLTADWYADEEDAGSDAGSELRVTPTGGFNQVCFAMGGDSDSDNECGDASSDSEYTSASSSDDDGANGMSAYQQSEESSSEEEESGDEDNFQVNIDQLVDALQAGVSAEELEKHVRGVLFNARRPKPTAETQAEESEVPKQTEDELIQEIVQIEEEVQSTVKKAIRKSLGRTSMGKMQKNRLSAIKRHRQSLGLSDQADEKEAAKLAKERKDAQARRRKSLARIITKAGEAAVKGEDLDVAIREAAENCRARHRKSVAKRFTEQKPPADVSEAFEVNDGTLAKITKARAEAAENKRKSLTARKSLTTKQASSAEESNVLDDKEDVQSRVQNAMALAAERRRKSIAEKQKHVQSAVPPAVPSETGTTEWETSQSGPGMYTTQAVATPYTQTNDWAAGQEGQQQQWNNGHNGWESQQQQQQDAYGWQQGNYQQQDEYYWQQQQNSTYSQQHPQQETYGNYGQHDQSMNWQHGGEYHQGGVYGWQQEWQQNADGTFYNTQTPSWESSMSTEELRIQRTVADMCRPNMYSAAQSTGYGHYGA